MKFLPVVQPTKSFFFKIKRNNKQKKKKQTAKKKSAHHHISGGVTKYEGKRERERERGKHTMQKQYDNHPNTVLHIMNFYSFFFSPIS